MIQDDFARTLAEVQILADTTIHFTGNRLVVTPYRYDNWEELYGHPRPDWVLRSNDVPTRPPFDLKQAAQECLNKAFGNIRK